MKFDGQGMVAVFSLLGTAVVLQGCGAGENADAEPSRVAPGVEPAQGGAVKYVFWPTTQIDDACGPSADVSATSADGRLRCLANCHNSQAACLAAAGARPLDMLQCTSAYAMCIAGCH